MAGQRVRANPPPLLRLALMVPPVPIFHTLQGNCKFKDCCNRRIHSTGRCVLDSLKNNECCYLCGLGNKRGGMNIAK